MLVWNINERKSTRCYQFPIPYMSAYGALRSVKDYMRSSKHYDRLCTSHAKSCTCAQIKYAKMGGRTFCATPFSSGCSVW